MDDMRVSKTLCYILRHSPKEFNLTLDHKGWVLVTDLLDSFKTRQNLRNVTLADLERIVRTDDKERYQMQDGKIRAVYGHSIKEKVVKQSTTPPKVLYHGTYPSAVHLIMQKGLLPMGRQYVHLSEDTITASEVGKRRDNFPIVLTVRALEAHNEGIKFYKETNGIWLSDNIPTKFITLT